MRLLSGAPLSLLVVLPVLTWTSCADRPAADAPSAGTVASPLAAGDSALGAFLSGGPIPPDAGRADIETRLGPPDSVSMRTVTNRHDPAMTDSVFVLHYAGATAEVYRAGYDGKEMLTELEIRDDRLIEPNSALRPGVTAAAVRELLGEPADTTGGVLRYECEACLVSGHETVSFVIADGRVGAIRIQYWID